MPPPPRPQTAEERRKLLESKTKKSGLRHTVYSVNGDQYTGEWLDNKKHGNGRQFWKKSGLIYEGEWRYGKREGYGILSKMVGKKYKCIYEGNWCNDKKDGVGAYFYSQSSFYRGEWKENQKHGCGRMEYENGEIYEGDWLKNKRDGQGWMTLANGNIYFGNWKDGMKHGHGQFFYPQRGQVYKGFWVNGEAKCGTVSDFRREEATIPTTYPIPQLFLMNAQKVLEEAQAYFTSQVEKSKHLSRPNALLTTQSRTITCK